MNRFVIAVALTLIASLPLVAAGPNACVLQESVLAPYANPGATDEQFAASRRAVSMLIGCDPASLDARSRALFFEVVDREFKADHRAAIARWAARHADRNPDGMLESLSIHQHELREYMDRLFDPRRDMKYKHVVLRYGRSHAIARLGPAAQHEVRDLLKRPAERYGVASRYSPQVEALGAIGEWLDPANVSFTPVEKTAWTSVLTGLLAATENVTAGQTMMVVERTLKSLARSDDRQAEQAIRRWMEKQPDRSSSLYRLAEKSAEEIRRKTKKS